MWGQGLQRALGAGFRFGWRDLEWDEWLCYISTEVTDGARGAGRDVSR